MDKVKEFSSRKLIHATRRPTYLPMVCLKKPATTFAAAHGMVIRMRGRGTIWQPIPQRNNGLEHYDKQSHNGTADLLTHTAIANQGITA
jgi:hypothetical protein